MSPNRTGSRYVWMIASIAALGGLLFGYDWVVIGGAKPFYEAFFGLTTPAQQGWVMSCALIGCFVGALISGVLSEAWGESALYRSQPQSSSSQHVEPPWPGVLQLSFFGG